mmetsp:Transcript_102114/g.243528  ORF Transcript_102114/g.243528 Transcript_102114/m.243528 type:complete len:291 (-) Transcript_102114:540-1412(-)
MWKRSNAPRVVETKSPSPIQGELRFESICQVIAASSSGIIALMSMKESCLTLSTSACDSSCPDSLAPGSDCECVTSHSSGKLGLRLMPSSMSDVGRDSFAYARLADASMSSYLPSIRIKNVVVELCCRLRKRSAPRPKEIGQPCTEPLLTRTGRRTWPGLYAFRKCSAVSFSKACGSFRAGSTVVCCRRCSSSEGGSSRHAKSATRSSVARSKALTKTSDSKFRASLERRKENSKIFFRPLQSNKRRVQTHGLASNSRVSCGGLHHEKFTDHAQMIAIAARSSEKRIPFK